MGAGSRFSSARYSATTNAVPLTSVIVDMSAADEITRRDDRMSGAVFFHVASFAR
jgi:hypothetical protein